MNYILGLSFGYHDSSAALVSEQGILFAAQEERFTRIKNDSSFPINAAKFVLAEAGISIQDVRNVVYYENPIDKLDRIIRRSLSYPKNTFNYVFNTLIDWHQSSKFDPLAVISSELGVESKKISLIDHHKSHSASCFYTSPFELATVITLDGVGEWATSTVSLGNDKEIIKLSETKIPHSIGLFYSAFTDYLGFEVNEGEYKVMGMSAFGVPRHADELIDLFKVYHDGSFKLDTSYFNFETPDNHFYNSKLVEKFGPPNLSKTLFMETETVEGSETKRFADIAASVQKCTEDVIKEIVKNSIKLTGIDNVCLSGGVALNSLANRKIQKELGCNLYIQPAAGDAGTALGAALFHLNQLNDISRKTGTFSTPYLGRSFSNSECRSVALSYHELLAIEEYKDTDILIETVADYLVKGSVIGWFSGRSEWGPRALGNRSILASPASAEMKDRVNRKIKFREPFRPFAPVTTIEDAHLYFDVEEHLSVLSPEYFMLSIHNVTQSGAVFSPATTHLDGSARLQVVSRDSNNRLFSLLEKVKLKTNVPILLNTSFNLRGEPIVDSPEDAIKTFLSCDLDFLVLENNIVRKKAITF